MNRLALAVAGMIALASTPVTAMTITENGGGLMVVFDTKANEMASTGEYVQFAGPCASGCTFFLRLSKICITPEARFGFHAAFNFVPTWRDHQYAQITNQGATRMMFAQYPDWVQDWIRDNGGLTPKMIWMDFETAKQHVKVCK